MKRPPVKPPTGLAARVAMLAARRKKRDLALLKPRRWPTTLAAMIPVWADQVRGAPNSFLRSALFSAVRRGRRRSMLREELAALDGIRMLYTGARLDQSDLDTWLTLLRLAQGHDLNEPLRFTAGAFLRELGVADNGRTRTQLDERLSRMNATAVDVEVRGRYSYEGSLIDDVYRDKENREYIVQLNPKLVPLLSDDAHTLLDWRIRRELATHPLAQWVHGFYSSHARPLPISAEALYRLSGSEAASVKDWKNKELRHALDAVAAACEKHGQHFAGRIDEGGIVHVQRSGSKSQILHLRKRRALAVDK